MPDDGSWSSLAAASHDLIALNLERALKWIDVIAARRPGQGRAPTADLRCIGVRRLSAHSSPVRQHVQRGEAVLVAFYLLSFSHSDHLRAIRQELLKFPS